jgi:flagellar biosynthesis/type III secretory pathway protein FliH
MDIFEQVAEWRYEDGKEEGLKEGKENSVKVFLANTEFSPEKIASLVDVPLALVKKIKKEMRSKKKAIASNSIVPSQR